MGQVDAMLVFCSSMVSGQDMSLDSIEVVGITRNPALPG